MNYRLTFDPKTPSNSKKNIDIHNNSHNKVSTHAHRPDDITLEMSDSRRAEEAQKPPPEDMIGEEESSDDEEEELSPGQASDKKREWYVSYVLLLVCFN